MPIIKEEPLKKYDSSAFNFKGMKSEVSEAIVYDHKRDQIDDAKKRAIVDSRNYDDFKSRVAGCHLKPIHRQEFNAPPKFSFNRQVAPNTMDGVDDKKTSSSSTVGQKVSSAARGNENAVPKSGREFERALRRCSSAAEKMELVKLLDEASYVKLFGRELDAQVLMQLLIAIDEVSGTAVAPPGTAQNFLGSLARLCPSSTAMAASFLIPNERSIVARLLAREQAAGVMEQREIVTICATLGVQPSCVSAAFEQLDHTAIAAANEIACSTVSESPAAPPVSGYAASTDLPSADGAIELMD